MKPRTAEAVIAGVICLDVIPQMEHQVTSNEVGQLFVPGKLINIGPAVTSTGGAVPNTGIALHRLGVSVRLMGKIGDDLFGGAVAKLLEEQEQGLSSDLIVSPSEMTSYTIVISPPGVDRIFLHCSGANDTFSADDIRYDDIKETRLFHFGYPPLMKRMYSNGGEEMAEMFQRVKELGITTSLDMAKPDPDSTAGRIDWISFLELVLPHVDVFLPSYEELLYMLDREQYSRLEKERSSANGDTGVGVDSLLLSQLADRLLLMGVAIVGIKLGEHGLYVKTTSDVSRFEAMGACWTDSAGIDWGGHELLAPCYSVDVIGTTGAGDCTIAGFLTGLLHGLPMERIILSAVAVGACNVERPDATSGVPSWDQVEQRMASGWQQRDNSWLERDPAWRQDQQSGLYYKRKKG